jgi:hypothetical protein
MSRIVAPTTRGWVHFGIFDKIVYNSVVFFVHSVLPAAQIPGELGFCYAAGAKTHAHCRPGPQAETAKTGDSDAHGI